MRVLFAAIIAAMATAMATATTIPAQAAHAEVGVQAASCPAFVVTGDPRATGGATWTYRSTDQGVTYAMEGILFVPATAAPYPAVVVSHGKGGTPRGYSATIARTMVTWGMVVIGPMYTHAPDADDAGNLPDGADGASTANVQRAHKARELLACVAGVDTTRVAAHGHSMGAFVTGQVLGTFTGDFRAASHTAGGVSPSGPNATKPAAAQQIVTPYQLHHGDADQVVALALDQTLNNILAANGVPHQLNVYAGFDHQRMAFDTTMLSRVRSWYQLHGVL